jgi:hypothetical protein
MELQTEGRLGFGFPEDEPRQQTDTHQRSCAPQKVDATSRCNFFEPIFMVQPAENISRSYPAMVCQLMAMDAWARPRPALGIRNTWSQARMGSSLIVQVDNLIPILLNCEKSVIRGIRGMGVLSGFMERW